MMQAGDEIEALARAFQDRQGTLVVVGLGYVGLAVAAGFASAGFHVVGVDRSAARVRAIQTGAEVLRGDEPELDALLAATVRRGSLRATTALDAVAEAAAVFVCVETPVEADHRPRYEALLGAVADLGPHLAPGALVIVESTVAPGTMRSVVIPALEAAAGGKVGERFHVGHCPERVTSGALVHNLRTMARVCGASSPRAGEAMRALYKHVVHADLDLAGLETAELVKTAENAYRDVALAFANELALLCEGAGADFLEVRRLVNKSPGRNVLFAGAGVGGHCIPKDSWLLAAGAPDVEPWLLAAARRRNDAMPAHVLARVTAALGGSVDAKRLAVLGYTYREDSGDVRSTPSEAFVRLAQAAGAEVHVHDPFVPAFAERTVLQVAEGADAVVILVAHSVYRTLSLEALAAPLRSPVLVDARNVFESAEAAGAGLAYHRVGLSPHAATAR